MLFPDAAAARLAAAYAKVERNMHKGSPTYYAKLPPEESQIIRADYRGRLRLPLAGDDTTEFYTLAGTHIATGYRRVVVGDYGAYIEFTPAQIRHHTIKLKFPGEPSRPVKYIWHQAKDVAQTKVYEQRATVVYADYKPGLYYISPLELTTADQKRLYDPR